MRLNGLRPAGLCPILGGMDTDVARLFLDCAARRLELHASRIADCLGRLTPDELWAREGEHENAIGNLVLHLCGNVRQWIGAGIAGEPDVRVRDREFSARDGPSGAELKDRLASVVAAALPVIRGLTPERLAEPLTVQAYRVTVLEGVYHVVDHFAQHTGQILFATKRLTRADLGYYTHLNRPAHGEKTP
jgi:uncharacterized damage-inducible protein DinB